MTAELELLKMVQAQRLNPAGPTVIHQLRFADYLRIDAVNGSSLVNMSVSAKHYRHMLTHAKDASHFRIGRAGHTLLLQPELFGAEYVVMPDEFPSADGKKMCKASRAVNSCAAWCEEQEARDLQILTRDEIQTATEMRDAVQSDELAMELLTGGHPELSLQWTDPQTGIGLKGRLDKLVPGRWIVDLKSARDPAPRAFERQSESLLYHAKLAIYQDAAEACGFGRLPVWMVVVGNADEHDVVVYEVDEEALEVGRSLYAAYLDRLAVCRATNVWPGVSGGQAMRLKLPRWKQHSDN